MSAGISYSALTSYGKATLPSAEGWGSNLNILRDPPKSITTRRVDKVFDDLSIVQTMADSRDRFCDHINVYARGVNPMVSVSYNNTKGRQAKLPYNVADAGAFRPPSQRPHDLLPLTRLPRLVTSAYAQPTNIDPTRKVITSCSKRDIKTEHIQTQGVVPIYSNPLNRSSEAPLNVKYTIGDPLRVSTKSTAAPQTTRNVQVSENFSMVREDTLKPQYNINRESVKSINNHNVSTDHYLHDKLKGDVRTNVTHNTKQVTFLDQNGEITPARTREPLHYQYETQRTRSGTKGIEHQYINLDKNLPQYEAVSHQTDPTRFVRPSIPEHQLYQNRPVTQGYTNYSTNTTKLDNLESRDYNLKHTLSLNNQMTSGGYAPTMLAPDTNSHRGMPTLNDRKVSFRQKVSDGFYAKNSI